MSKKTITYNRERRKSKILKTRSKNGSSRYELLLHKTNNYIYGQLLDLRSGLTFFSASSSKFLTQDGKKKEKLDSALALGDAMAKYCLDKKIMPSVNVAGCRFHGLVKAMTDRFYEQLKNS